MFAKAPVAGYAKTRLAAHLGVAGAAALQARLIRRSVATALAAGLGEVSLWCTPNRSHPVFAEHGVRLYDQAAGDLGERMLDAFGRFTPLLLIGTDCPALTADHLIACAAALRDHDAVFLPAEDGGYVLVGLARPIRELFRDIPWGTPRVMAETRARAAGLRVAEPAVLWDLDDVTDYQRAEGQGLLI